MSKPFPVDLDDQIIEVEPPRPRRRRIWWILAAFVLIVLVFRTMSIYIETLWYDSLGYLSVYWYTFRIQLTLFVAFTLLTAIIIRGVIFVLERVFDSDSLQRRVILVNNQPVTISPGQFLKPVAWIATAVISIGYGISMIEDWQMWALYFNHSVTSEVDPIFQKPVSFYLFTFPIYSKLAGWLSFLAFVILLASIGFALLSVPKTVRGFFEKRETNGKAIAAVSVALALFLFALAWNVYLSRFPHLWANHQTFSGVTYTEANYLLPGLTIVALLLAFAGVAIAANAFTIRRLRVSIAAILLPVLAYVIAGIIVPSYVTTFIVKPNELARETPYIAHNIAWTRRAFGLEGVEERNFLAEPDIASLGYQQNQSTFENIRLWDWRALQDTLHQIQAIRIYYDFHDVDVDRYVIDGQLRQVMVAARELDVQKLPASSQNWVNQRLIYTHGYGVTMNTANDFTPEGMPRFILSNMPVESISESVRVTRPEIYFGQKTDTNVYVMTDQQEFDYPRGEQDTYTRYEGTGGIPIGGFFKKLLLAWKLGDLSKLPFSDVIRPDSRVLIRRNIIDRVQTIAPFLVYDKDPYMVVGDDGRLYWIIDAYTSSAHYPYSRHYDAAGRNVNYIRNSIKATVDAYDGTVNYYVFDPADPVINAYRAAFPVLFKDSSEMSEDLRSHIRYPETLISTQGEVFSLYHSTNPIVLFQREDVWSVARQVAAGSQNQESQPIEPYFVLMQLPGEEKLEFVEILPFTPANRNNMIGWMAGRSDGDNYGKLLVYRFPTTRLVNGPLQIEARIDQNSYLSSQFTLWSQQGSRVRRGNLLVIPAGDGLLYVEPIYLQAARSPMPELRLVVLATQDRLAYGSNYREALTMLFGPDSPAEARPEEKPAQPGEPQPPPTQPAVTQTTEELVNRAAQQFDDYQRLTSEGRHGEAGRKLEELKRTLDELKSQKPRNQ